MQEVELKFRVAPGQRAAVGRAVAGRSTRARQHLVAVYVDTAERALAQAALALRVRREGGRWVQTLKAAGDDGLTRLEHNVVLAARGTAPPLADPARHAGTPAGERLAALLDAHAGEPLQPIFSTDVKRRTRSVRRGGATVELAFDEGRIVAGDAAVPVCELEIELKQGAAGAVIDEARRWIDRFGVTLDARTKAHRGDLLSRGATVAAARTSRGTVLDAEMSVAQARRVVLRLCADQIVLNASQIASGEHGPEHVHQLRVGLRRLRTALRVFDDDAGGALGEAAAQLFRRLGAVRDADVMHASFGTGLADALHAAGLGAEPLVLLPAPAPEAGADAAVRDAASQHLLLDLIAQGLEPAEAEAPGADGSLRAAMARRIARWHHRASRDAARYARLDDEARHALRKRIKRLRYAVEFAAALFPAKAVRRYLVPLKALQERLGELNDAVVAIEAVGAARNAKADDVRLAFALGWLTARREALVERAGPALAAFAAAKAFWKNRKP